MKLEWTQRSSNKATKPWLSAIHLSGFCQHISTFSIKSKVRYRSQESSSFAVLTVKVVLKVRTLYTKASLEGVLKLKGV